MEDKYLTRSYGSVNTAPGIITSFHSRFTIFLSPTKGQLKETQPWKQCGTAFKDVQMERKREDISECSITDWRASNGEGGSPNIMINRGAQSAATHYSL